MGLQVHKGCFAGRGEALLDIASSGFWPSTFASGPTRGLDVHWHDVDVHAYVVEGATSFLDGESGRWFPVEAGDKVVIPARALHAEGPVPERVVYIIALPDAQASDRQLRQRPPQERGDVQAGGAG